MSKKGQPFTEEQLYGPGGQPRIDDIEQNDIFNCYFVSSMGALAKQQPDRISGAIRSEPDPNNPGADMFYVTLHHPKRGMVEVPVTQADIEDNIKRDGGGKADGHKGAPLWPSVLEAGFAKLYDPDPQSNNRNEAYKVIGSPKDGGALTDAMFALTGETGQRLRYSETNDVGSGPPGHKKQKILPFHAPVYKKDASTFDDASDAYTNISGALGSGKTVTLSTRRDKVDDGLMENHAYIVTGIEQRKTKDGKTEVWITLQNPYGHNQSLGEPEKKDTSKATTTVSFDQMLKDGVFGEFNIGPAPLVKAQHHDVPQPQAPTQSPAAVSAPSTAAQSSTPSSTQDTPAPPATQIGQDIRNREHPGHAHFQQALNAIERSPNIPPGTFAGERLQQTAANLTCASLAGGERPQGGQNERLDCIDFALFNRQRDGLIAGQGEIGSPTAKLAFLPAMQDNTTSLAAASQQVNDTLQRMQTQNVEAVHRSPQQAQEQSGPTIGPRMV